MSLRFSHGILLLWELCYKTWKISSATLHFIEQAEVKGRQFLCRTAASFVSARIGIIPKAPILPKDLGINKGRSGGLIVVGSYVPKTTKQVKLVPSEFFSNLLFPNIVDVIYLLHGYNFCTLTGWRTQVTMWPFIRKYWGDSDTKFHFLMRCWYSCESFHKQHYRLSWSNLYKLPTKN